MATAASNSRRLHRPSQGWKQTRPQTDGRGFSRRIVSHASLNSPCAASISILAMSSPAGQAALQGEVFSSYRGRRKRQEPVLLLSVVR